MPTWRLHYFADIIRNWAVALCLPLTSLGLAVGSDLLHPVCGTDHSIRMLLVLRVVYVDSGVGDIKWQHVTILRLVIFPSLPIRRMFKDIDVAQGSRCALGKFIPELTRSGVINKIVEPIARHYVFSQESISAQLVFTHKDACEVWRVDIHRPDAVSAMSVDPLLDALPKVSRVKAFTSSPIFWRR